MKERPSSRLSFSGRGVSRKRRGSPTRWNRTFRSQLKKGSLDDLVLGMLDMSVAPREIRPATRQASTPAPCGPESSDLSSIPASAKGKEKENSPVIPSATLVFPDVVKTNAADDSQGPDPFRNPVQIPLTTGTWVYPHSASAIDDAFQDRFREIQNYFRRNTEVHPELKVHVEHIDYVLKMCGPSVEEAQPSIIVFCRPSEFKALRTLLNEKHLKRQWCRRRSSPSYLFWRNWNRGNIASNLESSDQKPLFHLYFWKTHQPRKQICLESTPVLLQTGKGSSLTLSGAVMAVPNPDGHAVSCSTVACTLQVGRAFYALTAGHVLPKGSNLFKRPFKPCMLDRPVQNLANDLSLSAIHNSGSKEDCDDVDFVSDVEYEDESEENTVQRLVERPEANLGPTLSIETGALINCTAVTRGLACPTAPSLPDLDWAVVELDSADLLRPNALENPSKSKAGLHTTWIYFSKIISRLPKKETAVLVNTSHGIGKAMLQPAAASLGGINYTCSESSLYWTLIMCSGEEISHGDSGSIVIDALTHAVYGHIVASNPIGEVYVSPMTQTVKQVQNVLEAEEVVLTEPLAAITKLACHYLQERRDDAFELLADLDELTKNPALVGISRHQVRSWERSTERALLSTLASVALTGTFRQIEVESERRRVLQRFIFKASSGFPGLSGTTMSEGTSHISHDSEPQQSRGKFTSATVFPFTGLSQNLSPSINGGYAKPTEGAMDMQTYLAQRRLLVPDNERPIPSMNSPDPWDLVEDWEPHKRRRNSLDEDMFYRDLMISRPADPPSYATAMRQAINGQKTACAASARTGDSGPMTNSVPPPKYTCDIHLEGVFMQKIELEDVYKRAKDRSWRMVYAELQGTMLILYNVKKERGWWQTKTKRDGICPDNPPWVKKGTVEKIYSLQHGDVGIAADYRKRRYVIRLRLEDNQFLFSCVELSTFVDWMDMLYAAMNVAAPIEERDFPRDYSITRVQRIRWFRGMGPQYHEPGLLLRQETELRIDEQGGRRDHHDFSPETVNARRERQPVSHPILGRLSATSFPNESLDPETEKWAPRHEWEARHDQLYAKLCYGVLLFKSPRRSNYMIRQGIRWYVDWATERMVRVLPPRYGEETELLGPWQVISGPDRLL